MYSAAVILDLIGDPVPYIFLPISFIRVFRVIPGSYSLSFLPISTTPLNLKGLLI